MDFSVREQIAGAWPGLTNAGDGTRRVTAPRTASEFCRGACMLIVPLMLAGCGRGGIAVNGSITYHGAPVDAGVVSFEPVDGLGGTAGGAIRNGRFALESSAGLTPGRKLVRFTATMKTGKRIPAGPPMPPDALVDEVAPIQIPPQTVEVVAGKINEFSFHLP